MTLPSSSVVSITSFNASARTGEGSMLVVVDAGRLTAGLSFLVVCEGWWMGGWMKRGGERDRADG